MSLDRGLQTAWCYPFSARAAWTWTLAASQATWKPACRDARAWETSNSVVSYEISYGFQGCLGIYTDRQSPERNVLMMQQKMSNEVGA